MSFGSLASNIYLLTGVFSVIECELIKLFKLVLIQNLLLQVWQLGLEFVDTITAQLYHAAKELLLAELALLLRLELPGDDEDGPAGGVQLQVIQELDHALHPDLLRLTLILVPAADSHEL